MFVSKKTLTGIILIILFSIALIKDSYALSIKSQINTDKEVIERVLELFCAAYGDRDQNKFKSIWSDDAGKLAESFFQTDFIVKKEDVKSLKPKLISITEFVSENENAHLLATLLFEPTVPSDESKGKTIVFSVNFIKKGMDWKITQCQTMVRALANQLIEAKTDEKRAFLINNERKLITVELRIELVEIAIQSAKQANYSKALDILQLARHIADEIKDQTGIARILGNMGEVYRLQNQYEKAMEYYRESLTLSEELKDKAQIAAVNFNLCNLCFTQSRYDQAIEYNKKSLMIREEINDKAGIATCLMMMSSIQRTQGNYEEAINNSKKSLIIAQELKNNELLIYVNDNIGQIYALQGKADEALNCYQQNLKLSEEMNFKVSSISTLNNIGIIYNTQGNFQIASEYFLKSLEVAKQLNDRQTMMSTFTNLGIISFFQGDYAQAIAFNQQAIELAEEIKDRKAKNQINNNLAGVYYAQGDYARSLKLYQKTLEVAEELKLKFDIARSLNNIGNVYRMENSFTQALDYYQKSLALREELKDLNGIASTLNSIGETQFLQHNYDIAMSYFQCSLKLCEELKDRNGIAKTFNSIGNIYAINKDFDRALSTYQQGIAIYQELKNRRGLATILNSLVEVYRSQQNYQLAIDTAKRSIELAKEVGDQEQLWRAFYRVGLCYQAQNKLNESSEAIKESIRIIESIRVTSAGNEQLQQLFFEDKIAVYSEMVELLVSQQQYQNAFLYAEQAKARVLLDVLYRGKVNIFQAMTAQEKKTEQELNNKLVSLNTQLFRAKQNGIVEDHTNEIKAQLEKVRLELETFQTQLYTAHPELKSKRGEITPLTPTDIEKLVDKDGALIEFVICREKLYMFVVTHSNTDAKEGVTTPLDFQLYPLEITYEKLQQQVHSFRDMLATVDYAFRKPARDLFDRILKPANRQLVGKKTVIIIPDGVLWELPFQAILDEDNHYLLDDYTIYYAPSVKALKEMRALDEKRTQPNKDAALLLAVGDPALNRADRTEKESSRSSSIMDDTFQPLQGAAEQVKAMIQMYGTDSSKYYLGVDAREDVIKAEAEKYRFLQFATHSIFNNISPMYSRLVLSQENNGDSEDGMLEAWEIMRLNLKADLAVLAACETGRGEVRFGEGIIGFTWSLFVAGCPTTVVSQWKVDDESTKELMIEFHRQLVEKLHDPGSPITKAAALQAAALKVKQQPRFKHPFYWAGFVLIGNGR